MEKTDLTKIYMHTANGKRYFPFAPKAEDVSLEVIAHHLANRARWAGATQSRLLPDLIFYSVAEHSVYVSLYLEQVMNRPDLALAGLLHDASEAYNGDLIRPLKYSPAFKEPFKAVEVLNETAVEQHFNITVQMTDPAIKIADDAVCNAEWQQIVPMDEETAAMGSTHHATEHTYPGTIIMLPPYQAKLFFLERYRVILERMNEGIAAE